ncbi:unnamed protein product [Cylindrotheca closterium]|uniref:Guanylate cyclase n=1 Tax=Cylindrotheca closterium TaxID=2856 RepID=A0AAD2PUM7_9STRA|nr:unnamed protein product [Cylindrotheca closterium]
MSSSSVLTSLRELDAARLQASRTGGILREDDSNIDIVQTTNSSSVPICHLSTLLPFTFGDFVPQRFAFEFAVGIALAAHQMNVGDGSVIPILDGLSERCNIKFTVSFSDTQLNSGVALEHIVDQIGRNEGSPEPKPCAFVGAYSSSNSQPTSIVTSLFGYPQVSGSSTSQELDNVGQHSLFARTIPSDADNAVPMLKYFHDVLNVKRFAIVHVNDSFGNGFVIAFRRAARIYAPDMEILAIPLLDGDERRAAEALLQSGFTYVFCLAFTNEVHDNLMVAAHELGVAGDGTHSWFFGDSFVGTLKGRSFEPGSALHKAYNGVGMLEVAGGLPGDPAYDSFVSELEKLKNPEDLEYLGSLFPQYNAPQYGSSPPFIDDDTFLSTALQSTYTGLFYEATIALGLAACSAMSGNTLRGQTHFDHLSDGSFTGVSGKVAFNTTTGTRDPIGATYQILNYLSEEVGGSVTFGEFTTDKYQNGEWGQVREYIFNDGTNVAPPDVNTMLAPTADPIEWVIRIMVPVGLGLLAVVLVYLFFERKRKQSDTLWYIKSEELYFDDPPEIIGRGGFGLILKAEYRGTHVAVKRVLPPRFRENNKRRFRNSVRTDSTEKTTLGELKESDKEGDKDVENVTDNIGMKSVGENSMPHILTMTGSVREGSNPLKMSSNGRNSAGEGTRRQLRKTFMREMRYLSKLRHSCIATVMGAVVEHGMEPMLVLEYMELGSFYDVLHNETMFIESSVMLHILQDVSQGMRFLHASFPQVIHGDLKAANILVDSRFRAKVSDFGLSQDINSSGCTGTPYWMAPELLRGDCVNTTATDVYSFGIILYEAYSRKDPYDGEDPATVLNLVADELVHKRPPTPNNMPAQIESLMKDSVQENIDRRPTFEEIDLRLQRLDSDDLVAKGGGSSHFGQRTTSISLYDIFPKHVAQALREGRAIEAEHHDMVTIFFSDIVGFTQLSAELEPRKVADLLNRLYTKFDALSRKYDVFKVETIGDAYMAVTNLVKEQESDHAKRIAEFAIEAIKEANETIVDTDDESKGYIRIRVGFHSGSVVADVVGTRNLRFCLFGDSVNTASRMESNSKANRIHCSSAAAELLSKQAPELPLRSRGKIPIKGKGNIHTYWVNEGSKSGVVEGKDDEVWVPKAKRRSSGRQRQRPSLLGISDARKSAANFLLRPLDRLKDKDRNRDSNSKSSEFSLIRDSHNNSNHSRSISLHSVDLAKVVEQLGSSDDSSGEINFGGSSNTGRRSRSNSRS